MCHHAQLWFLSTQFFAADDMFAAYHSYFFISKNTEIS